MAIEINPVDTYGSITKKRGVVIRSASELDDISRLLSHPKVGELSKKIEGILKERLLQRKAVLIHLRYE